MKKTFQTMWTHIKLLFKFIKTLLFRYLKIFSISIYTQARTHTHTYSVVLIYIQYAHTDHTQIHAHTAYTVETKMSQHAFLSYWNGIHLLFLRNKKNKKQMDKKTEKQNSTNKKCMETMWFQTQRSKSYKTHVNSDEQRIFFISVIAKDNHHSNNNKNSGNHLFGIYTHTICICIHYTNIDR